MYIMNNCIANSGCFRWRQSGESPNFWENTSDVAAPPRGNTELKTRIRFGVPDAVDEDSSLVEPVRHGEAKVLVDWVLEEAHPHHLHGHAGRAGRLAVP